MKSVGAFALPPFFQASECQSSSPGARWPRRSPGELQTPSLPSTPVKLSASMRSVALTALVLAIILAAPPQARAQDGRRRAEQLLAEGLRLQSSEPKKARALLDEARRAMASLNDPRLVAQAHCLECELASGAAALRAFETGFAAATRANSPAERARLLLFRSEIFEDDGKQLEAERDAAEALRLARAAKSAELEADALEQSGYLKYVGGLSADAISELQASFEINARLGREKNRLDALAGIAHIYAEPGAENYDRAIEYYEQALAGYEKLGERSEVADTLFNVGSTYQKKGDVDAALRFLRRAARLFTDLGKPSDAALTKRQIGIVFTKSGRPGEALSWFNEALAYYTNERMRDDIANTRQARGAAYTKLRRPDEAIDDLVAALPHFEATKSKRYLQRIHEDLAANYAATGRFEEALRAKTRELALQRALFTAERNETAARLRVEFDTARRDEENRALIRENSLRAAALDAATRANRLQWLVIVLTASLAVALTFLAWRMRSHARRMQSMAMTDELTRLPNRRHVLALAEDALTIAKSHQRTLAVLMLDIDHFKQVNDRYGHAAGDAVLRRVAHTCRVTLRPSDVVGRIGGEEFLVLLRDVSEEEAVRLAERLRAGVEAAAFPDIEPTLVVTISIGVASSGEFDSLAKLTQAADARMYQAKERGRNRVVA